jgi:glycosyltransferase involved in cell wall biosynthesis
VPDRFNEPWQSRHQILTRLSHYFHVVWVEPAHGWRDVLWARRRNGVQEPGDESTRGFVVYTPEAWLPNLHRPTWLGRLLHDARLARARRILVRRGCRQIVVSLWRPEFEPALAVVPHDLAAYHIDDEYTFSSVETAPDHRELRLIEAADLVTVHSHGLQGRKGLINPRTVFVPNGVDYATYATAAAEPADLAPIPHPRIGYTGYIKTQLDWDLLQKLIVSHRGWSFVFVGPQRPHVDVAAIVEVIGQEPNVHFLGPKGRKELAAYAQHFDVCVMPYKSDAYTRCIYPLKLHEYLATGRPVIGSRISTLEEFADVVTLAGTPSEWSAAITMALGPAADADSRRLARQTVARKHDWKGIARRVAETIAGGL